MKYSSLLLAALLVGCSVAGGDDDDAAANDDDAAANDDDATANDDDATANDDDATANDDDAPADDDDATADDDDATADDDDSGDDDDSTLVPETDLYVQVTWSTPADPDETDAMGSDMDLHWGHPNGSLPDQDGDGIPDPWFQPPWDCYWANNNPNWGNPDPQAGDDPLVVLDDGNGLGPEAMEMDSPESVTYQVGVHYYSANGYGDSTATVTVYFGGTEVGSASAPMSEGDFWTAGQLDGATGTFTAQTNGAGGPLITANYVTTQ